MKKLLSLILCLLVIATLTTSVFAEEAPFIIDGLERLEDGRQEELNEIAKGLKETYGINVYLAYVEGHADDTPVEMVVGDEKDYVLLLMGERGTRILTGGKGDEIFSVSEDRDRLGYVHDEQDEWDMGVARYLEVVEEYLKDALPEENTETETPAEKPEAEEAEAAAPAKAATERKTVLLLVVVGGIVLAGIAFFCVGKKRYWF